MLEKTAFFILSSLIRVLFLSLNFSLAGFKLYTRLIFFSHYIKVGKLKTNVFTNKKPILLCLINYVSYFNIF